MPHPLSEYEVKNVMFSVMLGFPGIFPTSRHAEEPVLELLRSVQKGSEDRKRSLGRLCWALRNKETQQKFVRLDGSIRTLIGFFTSSLADVQMQAGRCLHELSHSSDPAVAEACLPVTSYLLTYLSGHSIEFTELCLYTLGNLVVESEAVRKRLLPQGIIPVLASCIQSPHEAVLEGLGYVLSQLLQAKEAPTEIIPLVLASALPQHMLRVVCLGLKAGIGAAVEFAWCLHYIISSQTANTVLLSLGALPALTSVVLDLASEPPQDGAEGLELLVCPVLRCLSNLLAEDTGCEMQVQDERLLIALFLILQSFLQRHPFIAQECLWLLNNLTAHEPFFCSALLSLDLLPALLQLLPCSQMATVLVLTVVCNIAVKGPLAPPAGPAPPAAYPHTARARGCGAVLGAAAPPLPALPRGHATFLPSPSALRRSKSLSTPCPAFPKGWS
ncbi:PREDICTED: transmembrane and coiled-coil domain-containing protein 6 [Nestor notabilis]|uniref:transmembrane and coiled-coil domain-containing protein 6 n=1 Tax=Nestor notabilis TaxID=176057 RepID=UPI00052389C5|nr:PREDICTED: transmembrane and coiled-coil domain-containing protein 6 [Nestor notabilis]